MNAVYSFLFIALSLSSAVSASECWPGWVRFEQSCYSFGRENVSWPEAASLCRELGGYIVEIDTKAENDWVVSQITAKNFVMTWIGANDILEEGTFRWLTSKTPVGTVPYWSTGQPNNLEKGEHCVDIDKNFGYRWSDDECNNAKPFVCEQSGWCQSR
ncbi:hypothetical protein BsWGS_24835 [Bradybaena similaris]